MVCACATAATAAQIRGPPISPAIPQEDQGAQQATQPAPEQDSPAEDIPRSQRDAQRGDLLAFFPGAPVLGDVCVTHPLAASNVRAAALRDGAAAAAADKRKRDKYGRTGTGACTFVPLSHETYGRVGPAAFAFLNRIADVAAGSGAASRRVFLENAMRDLSTTLCRAVARQVRAAAPLQARHAGKAVLVGLAVPADDLPSLAGHLA